MQHHPIKNSTVFNEVCTEHYHCILALLELPCQMHCYSSDH